MSSLVSHSELIGSRADEQVASRLADSSGLVMTDNEVGTDDGLWASLHALDGTEVLHCKPDDLGEGGLHITAPVGHGFAVGQRYKMYVGRGEHSSQGNLIGDGQYATVVRTEFLMGEQRDSVGVGLRFDHPIFL